ncbi:MAG: hypothetical protein MUC49_02360 [Raineya sp.]|jgi:hypothetical protein|nr:hypothetical protein [Raineya sp.]
MNERNQNPTNLSLIDRLVGKDGIKTDLLVRIQVPDDFYIKIGTTILLVGILLFIGYYSVKSL